MKRNYNVTVVLKKPCNTIVTESIEVQAELVSLHTTSPSVITFVPFL